MYEIYLERGAERDLRRLSTDEFHRLIDVIQALAENPRPPGCRKITGSTSDWRIRVGSYRVLCEIDDRPKTVRVIHAGQTPARGVSIDDEKGSSMLLTLRRIAERMPSSYCVRT